MDALLGVATGWIWEDLGMSGVKSGCKSVERWIEQWNGRDSKGDEDGDTDGAKVIPLRRTGYLSVSREILLVLPTELLLTPSASSTSKSLIPTLIS